MPRTSPRRTGDPLFDATPVATLDLHGFTAAEAERAVVNVVRTTARRHPGGVVHVITGKGRGSGGGSGRGGSVLRPLVKRLLTGELKPLIGDFARDLDEGGWLVRVK
ncbi:MAG TPA: Smr/MutS family protein [Gemmatimonadales bacterium]|nr:Smr/MutS family protein [Gemmatimonadales bacterium]